jgi:RNA polymerase sigma-70 factor (ECF subfamily)
MAKDVIQNVFVKIWQNPEIIDKENPEAFLFKMVKNASINFIRHLKVVDNLKTKIKEKYIGEELYNIDFVGNEPVLLIEKEMQTRILKVVNSNYKIGILKNGTKRIPRHNTKYSIYLF